jgi:hypothetical protein
MRATGAAREKMPALQYERAVATQTVLMQGGISDEP